MKNSFSSVLVVEDNSSSRQLLCEMLALLGYHTFHVASAEEAIGPLKTGNFEVLLADINLPGMSGIELAKIAVKHTPRIRIIFASGYGYLVTDKTDFDFTLLPKPYTLNQLQHVLARAHEIE